MIPEFFTVQSAWDEQIDHIVAGVANAKASEDRVPDKLELRRTNRIAAVHSSTEIEGNRLTLDEATAVANNEPVFAPARDVLELQNALAAYEALESFDPWSVEDFLRAHGVLMQGLVAEAGAFRSVDVEIVNARGEVVHTGSRSAKVPRLIAELLEWGRSAEHHPLVTSSAAHFLIEHIHPFRDGNGRIGRLWQTLVLSQWEPLFAWMPTEVLIRTHQSGYYEALQASREPEIDAAPFISFMLGIIEDSLHRFEDTAHRHVGIKVGINEPAEAIMSLVMSNPRITAVQLAEQLDLTPRHVERLMKRLRDDGRLGRIGSRKSGQWQILHPEEGGTHE